ncbi:MAG: hypothetical protein WB239_05140 [Acidimicrobiia bacterium]
MNRVLVAVEGEVTMRAAHSLAAQPGIDQISLLAPARSASFPTVERATGYDLVVGRGVAAEVGVKEGIPAVVEGTLGEQPGVYHASLRGLAMALAVGVEGVDIVAVALPGEPQGRRQLVFPSPIDARNAVEERMDGHELSVANGTGPLAAAMVLGGDRHRVIIDDHHFMAGIALAAAAAVALADPPQEPEPVWTRAVDYLRVAADMGLVIGERAATG